MCFVIQMKGCHAFCPNERTHPEFGAALRDASAAGVRVLAVDCAVTPESLTMENFVSVRLKMQDTDK